MSGKGEGRVRRYCQLVVADSSASLAVGKKCAVEMEMHLEPDRGGFMGVPLRSVKLGDDAEPIDMSAFTGGKEVYVVFDTGSQGFFVIDNTLGKNGKTFTEEYWRKETGGYGSGSGEYQLILGDKGGETFTLTLPDQWLQYQDAPNLISQRADAQASASQTLIVGNPWLQAVAVTFDVSNSRVQFSHLDLQGDRVAEYAGPTSARSSLSRASSSASFLPPEAPVRQPSGWEDGVYAGPQLRELSLAQAADEAASSQTAQDVTLDMRFMYYYPLDNQPRADEGIVVSSEEKFAGRMILPTLDADIITASGQKARVSQIVDTGSGVSFLLNLDLQSPSGTAGESQERGGYFCAQGGTTAETFTRRYAQSGGALTQGQVCGKCQSPYVEAHQLGKKQGCNNYCCLDEGAACEEVHQCTQSFCTGVVSYVPRVPRIQMPSENGSRTLKNLRTYVAQAKSICIPGLSTGLWGFWYWNNPLKTKDSQATTQSSGLPYYLLAQIGQVTGKLNNITFKFWRDDLQKSSGGPSVPVGRTPKTLRAPSQPFWMQQTPPSPDPSAPDPPAAPGAQPPDTPPVAPPSMPPASPPSTPPASPPSAPPASPPIAPPASPSSMPPASPPSAPPPAQPTPGPGRNSDASLHQSGRPAYNEGGVQQIVYVDTQRHGPGGLHEGDSAPYGGAKALAGSIEGLSFSSPLPTPSSKMWTWGLVAAAAALAIFGLVALLFASQRSSQARVLLLTSDASPDASSSF